MVDDEFVDDPPRHLVELEKHDPTGHAPERTVRDPDHRAFHRVAGEVPPFRRPRPPTSTG
jgi:hypothetical protein